MATIDIGAGQRPTDQDDDIAGTARNDAIAAGAGNDLITGGGGNDAIDGGLGTDTVAYGGSFAQYRLSADRGPGDWAVQDLRAGRPDGSNALSNVERLRFADATALLAANKAPAADNVAATINEDSHAGVAFRVKVADFLAAHARDPDGDAVSLAGLGRVVDAGGVEHGSVGVETAGTGERWVVYAPEADYSGALSFTYMVQDFVATSIVAANPALSTGDIGLKTAQGIVSLTVAPINDAPTLSNLALRTALAQDGKTLLTLSIAATDPDGPEVTARVVWDQGQQSQTVALAAVGGGLSPAAARRPSAALRRARRAWRCGPRGAPRATARSARRWWW